jgi:hypothetical protein
LAAHDGVRRDLDAQIHPARPFSPAW